MIIKMCANWSCQVQHHYGSQTSPYLTQKSSGQCEGVVYLCFRCLMASKYPQDKNIHHFKHINIQICYWSQTEDKVLDQLGTFIDFKVLKLIENGVLC